MEQFFSELKSFFRKGDLVLLLLCLGATGFGCLAIASATNPTGAFRSVVVQVAAALLGVLFFIVFSSIDTEFFSEHRLALVLFNTVLLLLLRTPFGEDFGTGNRSWLDIPLVPFSIQPAEICKITYILIMASVMASHQNQVSSIPSVFHMVFHLALLVGVNYVMSNDAGVSLIFVFIFIGMTFAGGVSLIWFLLAGGGIAAAIPFLWNYVMAEYQKDRFRILWDPTVDPNGEDQRYHSLRSLYTLRGGGWVGQGLFNGNRVQADSLPAQHTDYIFSSIGEELGFLGCVAVMVLLFLIVWRCIYVGTKSPDYLRRLVCFGAASALIFQIMSNIGMCLGVTPVIGLTLPFFSYGGSSLVTIYAMLGLVSGVHARPEAESHQLYVRPIYPAF